MWSELPDNSCCNWKYSIVSSSEQSHKAYLPSNQEQYQFAITVYSLLAESRTSYQSSHFTFLSEPFQIARSFYPSPWISHNAEPLQTLYTLSTSTFQNVSHWGPRSRWRFLKSIGWDLYKSCSINLQTFCRQTVADVAPHCHSNRRLLALSAKLSKWSSPFRQILWTLGRNCVFDNLKSMDVNGHPGRINVASHRKKIANQRTQPVQSFPNRAAPRSRKFKKTGIEKMLLQNRMDLAQTEWAQSFVFAPNEIGTQRFFVNYRKLNAVVIRDSYPVTGRNECTGSLSKVAAISTLEVDSEIKQVKIDEADRYKTVFTSHHALYWLSRMLCGLNNALARSNVQWKSYNQNWESSSPLIT